ncbi:DUF5703 domain-containing protein [uncultured Parabacteroides sp.]|uniref:DUF5703 domain-containing protein n=1 Tax=uncultured Parabacteroides sp. TaxID=512312 RepID=UPI00259B0840|nr:DUF5703 domain-containing protein [uncultured Parabacteroides sp.]
MEKYKLSILIIFFLLSLQIGVYAQSDIVNDYSVLWNSPSEDASGAMPIGNGEVGANVWMERNGNLVFYLSRTDAWSENSALYKLGKLRVSFYPCLQGEDVTFRQFLNLEEGKIEFEIKNSQEKIALEFLVDNGAPVVYLKGKSSYPVQVNVSSEIWRTQTRLVPARESHLQSCPHDSLMMEYADIVKDIDDNLIVYHRNEHSIYPFTLKHQGLEDGENEKKDPFIHRTMGYNVSGEGFVKLTPTMISSKFGVNDFCLKIVAYTEQTETEQEWIDHTEKILCQAPAFDVVAQRTADWWKRYWDKSYVVIETPDQVTGYKLTQAYILQNWMFACGGRGNYPIKFNGSIFTVEPCFTDNDRKYNPDYRMWGPDYWWQNTRLIYHPMLKSGDYDMIHVLLRHYFSNLPMLKKNARIFYGVDGALNPETSTIFGTFRDQDYGWDRTDKKIGDIENPYIRYYWSSGLEIVGLMSDYYQYTLNKTFAIDTLVPMAREVLKFYHSFFSQDESGKLRITPTHSLETYWDNVCNDLPNIAGLHYVLNSLLDLPSDCSTAEDRLFWKKLRGSLPAVPTERKDGRLLFVAAERYEEKRMNMENPELYAIFPFPLCNISTSDKQLGIDTYKKRIVKNTQGWTQDGQQAARLGLTEEAKENILAKIRNKHPNHRFPVYWGPNFDWTPDQNHGGNMLLTLQEMILQSYGKSIYVLPAFPKEWNVSFKLYSLGNNPVCGKYEGGKWVNRPSLDKKSKQRIYVNDK